MTVAGALDSGTRIILRTPEEQAAETSASVGVSNLIQQARRAIFDRDIGKAKLLLNAAEAENEKPPLSGKGVLRVQIATLVGETLLEEGKADLVVERLEVVARNGWSPMMNPTLAIAYARTGKLAEARAIAKSSFLDTYSFVGPQGTEVAIKAQDLPSQQTLAGVEATAHLSKGLELWYVHERAAATREFLAAATLAPNSSFAQAMAGVGLRESETTWPESKRHFLSAKSVGRAALNAVIDEYLVNMEQVVPR